jgi:hypothetical protein
MKNEKKTIITIETWQTTILHRRQTKTVWCEMCEAKVEMLSPAHAALISNADERVIFRRIEDGELHFAEISNGQILICSRSLKARNLLK